MSDTKQAPVQHDNTANLPVEPEGYRAFPIAKVQAYEAQTIATQGEVVQQSMRTLAYVLTEKARKFASRFTHAESTKLHQLMQSVGLAYDKAFRGSVETARGPQHILIQLFGNSGAGTQIARNLTAMLPTVDVVDAEVVADECDNDTSTPSP